MIELEACSGCAACEQICPQQCIAMKYNTKGFLYPVIDETKCVKCGLCDNACEKAHENNIVNCKTYIAYAVDDGTRKRSTSGGVFSVLAEYVLDRKGVYFGAVFDENYHVIHKKSNSKEELNLYRGSKYVQSNVLNTYREVKECLENNLLVLYTGTPCQIAGLYGFLDGRGDKNLISVSLICHGVPSPGIWDRYLEVQKANHNSSIKKISFREKNNEYRWGQYHLNIEFETGSYDFPWYEDLYYLGYEYDFFHRPSCARCSTKGVKQKGDIVIGDHWSAFGDKKYKELDGISSVMTLTENGESVINGCRDKLKLIECEYKDLRTKNEKLDTSIDSEELSNIFWKKFFSTGNMLDSIKYTKTFLNWEKIKTEGLKKLDETIVVWGIGKTFDENIMILLKKIKVNCLCDSNDKLVGESKIDIPVISHNDLKRIENAYVIIMVDNISYVVQIIKKLQELGIKKYDFWRTLI